MSRCLHRKLLALPSSKYTTMNVKAIPLSENTTPYDILKSHIIKTQLHQCHKYTTHNLILMIRRYILQLSLILHALHMLVFLPVTAYLSFNKALLIL